MLSPLGRGVGEDPGCVGEEGSAVDAGVGSQARTCPKAAYRLADLRASSPVLSEEDRPEEEVAGSETRPRTVNPS